VGPVRKYGREFNAGPWLGGAVIALLVAAALYWWFVLRSVEPPATLEPAATMRAPAVPDVSASESASTTDSPPDVQPVDAAVTPEAEVVAGPLEEASPATGEPVPVAAESVAEAEPASTAPQVQIDLAFSGDCWTEVSDASGRRLYYDLGRDGRVISLSGDAPLRVILGDSYNVRVTVNGRDWQIPDSARSGRLARLTIDAQ
jgi:cytoskeleton protein RodZ